MRYKDFKLDESELLEIKMSPGNLDKLTSKIDAKVGFEFEMIIPGVSISAHSSQTFDRQRQREIHQAAQQARTPSTNIDQTQNPFSPDYEGDRFVDDQSNDPAFPTHSRWYNEVREFYLSNEVNDEDDVEQVLNNLSESYDSWVTETYHDRYLEDHRSDFIRYVRDNLPSDMSDEDASTLAYELVDNGWSEVPWEQEAYEYAYGRMMEEFHETYRDIEPVIKIFMREVAGLKWMSDLYSSEYNQHGHPTRGVLISWPIRHELSPEEICDSLGYTQEQIESLRRQAQTGQTQQIQPARVTPGNYDNSNYEANEPYILSYLEDPTPLPQPYAGFDGSYTTFSNRMWSFFQQHGANADQLGHLSVALRWFNDRWVEFLDQADYGDQSEPTASQKWEDFLNDQSDMDWQHGVHTIGQFVFWYNHTVHDDLQVLLWPGTPNPNEVSEAFETDPEKTGLSDFEQMVKEFEYVVGVQANFSTSYHGSKREVGKWNIEADPSLKPNDPSKESGIEFITPKDGLPLAEFLEKLPKVLAWAEARGAYTSNINKSGLHMNVSVPNWSARGGSVDYVKLALLLGDKYVSQLFDRSGNQYANSSMELIKQKAIQNPEAVLKAFQQVQDNLNTIASRAIQTTNPEKYYSINIKNGYVEFRAPGGDWLEQALKDPTKLPNTLKRMVVALDAATDQSKYREEFLKKFYKELAPKPQNKDITELFVKFTAGKMPVELLKIQLQKIQRERGKNKSQKVKVVFIDDDQYVVAKGDFANTEDAAEVGRRHAMGTRKTIRMVDGRTGEVIGTFAPPQQQRQPNTNGTEVWGIWNDGTGEFVSDDSTGEILRFPTRNDAYTTFDNWEWGPDDDRSSYDIRPIPSSELSPQQPQDWQYHLEDEGGRLYGDDDGYSSEEEALQAAQMYARYHNRNIFVTHRGERVGGARPEQTTTNSFSVTSQTGDLMSGELSQEEAIANAQRQANLHDRTYHVVNQDNNIVNIVHPQQQEQTYDFRLSNGERWGTHNYPTDREALAFAQTIADANDEVVQVYNITTQDHTHIGDSAPFDYRDAWQEIFDEEVPSLSDMAIERIIGALRSGRRLDGATDLINTINRTPQDYRNQVANSLQLELRDRGEPF